MGKITRITTTFILLLLTLVPAVKAQNVLPDTIKEGDVCPDIVMKDTSMASHTLKEFRGKYVMIDVWASWCYPCRKEAPFLHQLEKELKGKNIVFVGVNVDNLQFRFRGSVDGPGAYYTGIQWWDKDKTFERVFLVDRIPRFILLDPEGKVLRYRMTRPSAAETLPYLQKLLARQ